MKRRSDAKAGDRRSDLILGQLVGQGSLLATAPFLARIYSPETVGIYQVALSLAIVLTPLATAGYEFSLSLARTPGEFRALLSSSRRRLALTVVVITSAGLIYSWYERSAQTAVISFGVGAAVLVYSLNITDSASLLRQGKVRRLGVRSALQGLLASILQVLIGIVAPSAMALIGALVLGRALGWAATWSPATVSASEPAEDHERVRGAGQLVGSQILGNLSSQIFALATFATLGAFAAGQLAMAQRMTSLPIALLSQGVSQIIIGASAPYIRSGQAGSLKDGLGPPLKRLVAFALLTGIAIGVLGPYVATTLLGPDWHDASAYIALLAAPSALQLIAVPLSSLFGLLGRHRLALIVQAVRCIMIAAAIFLAAVWLGSFGTIAVGALAWTVSYILLLVALGCAYRSSSASGSREPSMRPDDRLIS